MKPHAIALSVLMVLSMVGGTVVVSEEVTGATQTVQFDFSSSYNADAVYGADRSGDFDGYAALITNTVADNNGNSNSGDGLPDDGIFPSTSTHPKIELDTNHNNDGYNAWQASGTGSLTTSVSNGQYETIHVIASAGGTGIGDPAKFQAKLHYADGSTGTSQEFRVPDWHNSTGPSDPGYALIDGMDRMHIDPASYDNADEPALWGFAVPANSGKTLEKVTFDVTENQAGSFNFFGGAATTESSDVVNNNPPTANDDSTTTDEDETVTYDVVANDDDPDGDSLDVKSITDGPFHGTATITGASDQIQFDPGADQHSDVTITYEVSDGSRTATATFSVTVNDAPEVSSITRASPTSQDTNASSVDFDVTFDREVSSVDDNDFTLSGTASGTIKSFGPTTASNTVTVTVDSISGDGDLRLDVVDDDSIQDTTNSVPLGGVGTSGGDGDGSYTSGETYTIDNTAPGFSAGASQTGSINEETTGDILDVEAGDDGTSGPDTNVDYSLDPMDDVDFSIDTSTGQLSLENKKDYENPGDDDGNNDYELTVTATDDVGNTNSQDVTVAINAVNEAPATPSDNDDTTDEVTEDATTGDTVGITAATTDPEGDSITWSLADNASGRFQIDSSGQITVDNASKLDYESSTTHTITVKASDVSLSSTSDFTISITDSDEAPTFTSSTSATVHESDSNGANVLDVEANVGGDPDEGVSYGLSGGNDDVANNSGGAFAIDSSGQITISDTEDIDESEQSSFSLTVEASEGSQSDTQTVDVTVTDDAAPALQPGSSTPVDDATDHPPSDVIDLSFDEDVTLGTGNIEIIDDGDDSSTRTLDVTRDSVIASGSTVTLSPINLESDTNYHVEIDNAAIEDTFSNSYSGISDSTTYNFTTADTAPTFTEGTSTSVTVTEDNSVGLTSELEVKDISASDTLNWSVASAPSNGNLSAVDNASESVSGSASPHTLSTSPTYTPDTDFVGSDSFDVDVEDDEPGSTDTINVSVTVDAVNDAPSFSLPSTPDQNVSKTTGAQTVTNFVNTSTFDPGPGESGQSISDFLVSTNDSSLFETEPDIDTSGDLTFTPAAAVDGTASVDVQVVDDGGTSNGGTDTSTVQRFNITVDNQDPFVESTSITCIANCTNQAGNVAVSTSITKSGGTDILGVTVHEDGDPTQTNLSAAGVGADNSTEYRIDITTNNLDPTIAYGNGDFQGPWTETTPQSGQTDISLETKPVAVAKDTDAPGSAKADPTSSHWDGTQSAEKTTTSIDIAFSTLGGSNSGDIDGAYVTTDAQAFASPSVDQTTTNPRLKLGMAAPHFEPGGTTLNTGSIQAHLPDSLVDDVWGGATSSQYIVTFTEGSQLTNTPTENDLAGGGTELIWDGYNYSSGTGAAGLDNTVDTVDAGSNRTTAANTTVTFKGDGSADEAGISSYEWDVDDDGTYELNGSPAPHSYSSGGTKTVTLRVTDNNNNTDTDTLEVTVDNRAPSVSSFGVSNPSGQDVAVSVDSDEQLSTLNVSISGAESAMLTQSSFTETSTGGGYTYEATYSGSTDGSYTATLDAAEDAVGNDGASGESETVTIDTSVPPPAPAHFDVSIDTPGTITAGNTLTVHATIDNIGGGSGTQEITFTVNGSEHDTTTVTLESANSQSVNFTYPTDAADGGQLDVGVSSDDDADSGTVTVQPSTGLTADAGRNRSVRVNETVTFDGSNSTDDVGITSYDWDFGDGTNATGQTATHTYSQPGTYTVELTVTDGAGNTDTATTVVSVVTLADATPVFNTTGLADEHDFGSLGLTETATEPIAIQNTGSVTLRAEGELTGNDTDQFRLTDAATDVAPGATETLSVTFAPDTRGTDLTATLNITTNDPETPTQTIALRGDAESPLISVTPADVLDFGTATSDQANETISKDVTITNDGNAVLNVTNLSLETGDDFEVDTTEPRTIAEGNSEPVTLTYTVPGSGGTVTDTLSVTSTDPDTNTVTVPIRAIVTEPSLLTQPDTVAFGNVSIVPPETTGNVSGEQTVDRRLYIENTGTAQLSNVTVAAPSNSTAVDLVSDGDIGTLSPAEGEYLDITATATQTTLGEHTATVTITADELDSPIAVNATMTATMPSVNVTDEVSFGTTAVGGVNQTAVQIKNTGNATLAVDPSTAFTESEQDWVTTTATDQRQLDPGETTSLGLQFEPDDAKEFDGELTLETNDPALADGVANVTVSGTGITSNLTADPSTLEFNTVGNGTTATGAVALTNDGRSSITDVAATLTGDSPDQFTLETNLTDMEITSNQSQTLTVTFEPTDLGEQTAVLRVTGSDDSNQSTIMTIPLAGVSSPPEVALSQDEITFDPVSVAETPETMTLGIENNGTAGTTLAVESVSLADTSSPFAIERNPDPDGTDLGSGNRTDIGLTFDPSATQTGTFSTDLLVTTSDPASPTVRVPISAESRAPDAVVRDDHLAGGEVRVGNTSEASVTLANDGTAALKIETVSIEGPDADVVDLVGSYDEQRIVPGSERAITVAVSPTETGSIDAKVTIETDDPVGLTHTNGTAVGNATVPLAATGVAPALSVTPANGSVIDAGETPVDSIASEDIIIENNGTAPLEIGAPSLKADSVHEFDFQAGPTSEPVTIAPGESARYTVGFSPVSTDNATARLVFPTTNDDDQTRLAFDLTGSGIDANLTVGRDTVDFGAVKRGNSTTEPLKLYNNGRTDATVTDVFIGGTDSSYFESSLDADTEIGAESTRTEAITAAPNVTGDLSAEMQLTFSDESEQTITLRATGVEAEPDIPGSISVAETRVGERSAQTVEFGNDGNAPYTIESVSVTGDTAQFEQNLTGDLADQTVPGGDSITAPLAFVPTDREDALAGETTKLTIEVETDAAAENYTVDVNATSVTSALDVTNKINFGDIQLAETVRRNITVENTPNATANITLEDTLISGEDPDDFAIVNGDAVAGRTLSPGQVAEIEIAFTPSEPESRSATLRLDTDNPGQPSTIVSLTNSETYVTVEFGSVYIDYFNTDANNQPATDVYSGIERDGAFDSFTLTASRGGDMSVNFTDVENESAALAVEFAGPDRTELDTVRVFESETTLSSENFTEGTLQFRVRKATLEAAGVNTTNQTDVEDAVTLFHSHKESSFEGQETRLVSDLGMSFGFEATLTDFSVNAVGIDSFNPTLETVTIPGESTADEPISVDATVENVGGHAGTATVALAVDGTQHASSTHLIEEGASKTVSLESESISETGSVDVMVVLTDDEMGTEVTSETEPVSISETTATPTPSPTPTPTPSPTPTPTPPSTATPTPTPSDGSGGGGGGRTVRQTPTPEETPTDATPTTSGTPSGGTPTPSETATAAATTPSPQGIATVGGTPDADGTAVSDETTSPESTPGDSGPGFGVVVAVLVLLGAGFAAFRRQH